MPTLELAIDARRAIDGQRQFEQAVGGVQRAATGAGGAVDRMGAQLKQIERSAGQGVEGAKALSAAMSGTSTAAQGLTRAVEGQTAAQKTLQRAFDVTGNFAKGFVTALAITPVVALGTALAGAATHLLDFGSAANEAEDRLRALRQEQEAMTAAILDANVAQSSAVLYGGRGDLTRQAAAILAQQGDVEVQIRRLLGGAGSINLDLFQAVTGNSLTGKQVKEYEARARAENVRRRLADGPDFERVSAELTRAEALPLLLDAQAALDSKIDSLRDSIKAKADSERPVATQLQYGGSLPPWMTSTTMLALASARSYRDPMQPWAYSDEAALLAGSPGIGMGQLAADPLRQFLATNRAPVDSGAGLSYAQGLTWSALLRVQARQQLDGEQNAAASLADAERSAWRVGSTLAQSLENAVFYAEDFGDALRGVFTATLQAIISETITRDLSQQFATTALSFFAANGAAFSGGNVQPFASGGVVGGPTYFPMSGGKVGLMGEAGPEAVMPLTRGPDGKLGVRSAGGGGGNVYITVNAADADSFRRSGAQIAADIRRGLRRVA